MEYFSPFPTIKYDGRIIKNVTARIDFLKRIKDNISLFQYINVTDGERPEDVAYKYYKDPTLYWIILYLNDIIDTYHDWPMTESQLYEYVQNKYGVENVYAVHHYETTDSSDLGEGIWVDFGTEFSTSVSNFSYEFDLNESKRKIKILKGRYLSQVLAEYKNSF